MNLISQFISVLSLVLGLSSIVNASEAPTWTRYKNYKIHLDVPADWTIERDLYGMPIMVLGPERDGERAVLSVQDTPIYNLNFDHKLLVKTKDQYYQGRKNFVENLGDENTKYLSEIPYRRLQWTNGNDGFEMGYRYRARGIELEERSIQVNCGKRLFLFKTLSSTKLPASDKAQLSKLVNELDCVATTAKDGAYEASPLQDFDRKFKDQMQGTVWPTKKDIKSTTAAAKAVMLNALVQFYKEFEAAGGTDYYSGNNDVKNNQFFAKIKDRTDRFFSVFLPTSKAKDGYDCFFGGWPSKFVKRNGVQTCGYPWETNPDYAKVQSTCEDGKLSCNPSLFGTGSCVDVSSANERAHATLKCELEFRASGKSYEDVVKDSSFDQNILDETISSAKDVCSQEPYASSNYGLCSTLKEKLGLSISNGKHAEDQEDVKFINGLDEMKPENFDEFVKATEQNYKEFEARCIDEKGNLKTEVQNCLEDHLAILQDLETIDKRAKDLGQELQEEEDKADSSAINNENCNKADCGAQSAGNPLSAGKTSSIHQEKEVEAGECTPEQLKRKKERECSWSKGMFMAGSCAWNAITSLVSSLWGTIKAIGELIWDGVKWVGNKLWQGAKWFAGLFGYEDESSKKVNTASQTNNSAIAAFKKDPTGSAINFFKTIYDGVADFVSTDVACEKWSGVPHFSTCLIPATSWKCQPCLDRVDTVCSTVGYVVGEVAPAFFTGGLTVAIKGTVTAAKITKLVSKASKLGKITRLESKLLKNTSRLTKNQKLIGKIYNVSRWPTKKYAAVKQAYLASKKIISGFKSKVFGKFDNIVSRLKDLRKKNFVYNGVGWLVNNTVIKPTKFAYSIATAPVRLPYKAVKKYVSIQTEVYKSGLKYGERKYNKHLIAMAEKQGKNTKELLKGVTFKPSNYSSFSNNLGIYGSLAKYPLTGSRMLDEFRERVSMQEPGLFWKSTKEIEEQAKAEGKNPEQVKAILKQNRIDRMTKEIVDDAWNSGKEPKKEDLNHLIKVSGMSGHDLQIQSIDVRLQSISDGKTPIFSQSDYNAVAKEQNIDPKAAQKKIQDEVKLQTLATKVIKVMDAGGTPDMSALNTYAAARGIEIDEIVGESINRKLTSAVGGITPVFSKLDYETFARINNLSIKQAKQELDAQALEAMKPIE